jgi:hypothetical protein
MKRKVPQPRMEEITKDMVFQRDNLVYIFFQNTGTWQIEINGLRKMPGEWIKEEFASNLIWDGEYVIRFIKDCGVLPANNALTDVYNPLTTEAIFAVQDNPNLKKGKFIYARLVTASEDFMSCN